MHSTRGLSYNNNRNNSCLGLCHGTRRHHQHCHALPQRSWGGSTDTVSVLSLGMIPCILLYTVAITIYCHYIWSFISRMVGTITHTHTPCCNLTFSHQKKLGTMLFGEGTDAHTAHHILSTALDAGVTLFDTAEMYPVPQCAATQGASERIVGEWLRTHVGGANR